MEQYFRIIQGFKPFNKVDERKILVRAKAGDNKAYNTLMNANLKFVVSVAKKYQSQGLSLEELVAEGNYGLCKAFKKFDLDRNVKFITYAV